MLMSRYSQGEDPHMKRYFVGAMTAALVLTMGIMSACSSKKSSPPNNKKSENECNKTTPPDPCDDIDPDDEEESDDIDDDDIVIDDEKEAEDEDNKFKIDPALYELYIEPPEMKNCHSIGKAYLRGGTGDDPTPRCDDTNYPAKFTCDEAGVIAAFKNNQEVAAEMAAKKAEGYIIDQCAEINSKPVVYFACFEGDDEKCVAPESLKTTTLTIKASKVSID